MTAPTSTASPAAAPADDGSSTVARTCPLCEAGCGLAVTVRDGEVTRIRGDMLDVFSRGYLCPKGSTLRQLHDDPDRLRTPLVKRDDRLEPVTWDEAWRAVAEGLGRVLDDHGRAAIGAYVGNPNALNLDALATRAGPERILDFRLRVGPYGDGFGKVPDGLSLDVLLAHPHGIDLGPLQPRMPEALRTPDGMIDAAPDELCRDVADRLRPGLDAEDDGLVLIGRRHLRSNNSWMHNVRVLVEGGPRCTLQVHPDDARARGLADGAPAEVRSRTGSVVPPVVRPRLRHGRPERDPGGGRCCGPVTTSPQGVENYPRDAPTIHRLVPLPFHSRTGLR